MCLLLVTFEAVKSLNVGSHEAYYWWISHCKVTTVDNEHISDFFKYIISHSTYLGGSLIQNFRLKLKWNRWSTVVERHRLIYNVAFNEAKPIYINWRVGPNSTPDQNLCPASSCVQLSCFLLHHCKCVELILNIFSDNVEKCPFDNKFSWVIAYCS